MGLLIVAGLGFLLFHLDCRISEDFDRGLDSTGPASNTTELQ